MEPQRIELVDASIPEPPVPEDARRLGLRRASIILGSATVVGVLVLIGSIISGGRDDLVPPESTTSTTTSPASAVGPTNTAVLPTTPIGGQLDPVGFVPWPDPPEDHDPIVIGRPGPDLPLLGEVTEMAVVYVNTLGRPTIIDLDTGRIEQVDIAATRLYDYFGVEHGRIVSFDDQNRNIPTATARSLLFHTHRDGAFVDAEQFRSSANPAPHLCLSSNPCAIDLWSVELATNGTDSIRRVDDRDDPVVSEILFGQSWITEQGTRLAPADFGFELRVPAPMGDEAWIVHQPD